MTPGENWIKLLRAYGPIPDDSATEAEHVDDFAKKLGLKRLTFTHPEKTHLADCFKKSQELMPVVVITGTAGDGKTTLCYEIIEELSGQSPPAEDKKKAIQTVSIPTSTGPTNLTAIFDLTAWRIRGTDGKLIPEQIKILETIADHIEGRTSHPFLIAVNDGQMHEIHRALPDTCSSGLRGAFEELIRMHAKGERDSAKFPLLKFVNLSTVPSDAIFTSCLDELLKRPEWICLEEESHLALFGPNSPIPANYALLSSKEMRSKLISISQLADASGFHLSIRSVFMLLANSLLGHPDARHGLLNPGKKTSQLLEKDQKQRGALHLNFFGKNLSLLERNQRDIFRFLKLLHIGDETTNDIDELLIFGDLDEELQATYQELISKDPFDQRSKKIATFIDHYIEGLLEQPKDITAFLQELADERRRVFLQSTDEQIENQKLWCMTVFHYAGDYLKYYFLPIREGESVPLPRLQKLIAGLNRVWTGLFISNQSHELFLASGLDMTTSPVSDLFLKTLTTTEQPAGISIEKPTGTGLLPQIVLRANNLTYSFDLTVLRFEFLMRVSDGAMPTSFSREAYEDLIALKQCALRDLKIKPHHEILERIALQETGDVRKERIFLNETPTGA